jgi:dCTP deaminase
MSTLSKKEILEMIEKRKLSITPILDHDETFDDVSVNVRLGNEFIIMKRQTFPVFDIADKSANTEEFQKKIKINYRDKFVLHPHELILGATLEYVSLPHNLMCYVIGKSSWGRAGLVIATATKVDPGFQGCITLEIINEGESPIILYPGVPIAQLVFHKLINADEDKSYIGNFKHSVGPVFPDFKDKSDQWKFWLPLDG